MRRGGYGAVAGRRIRGGATSGIGFTVLAMAAIALVSSLGAAIRR